MQKERTATLSTVNNQAVLLIENHPNDSRVKIREDGKCQTLSGRMGTGGGNVPMVLEQVSCIGNGQVNNLKPSKLVGALNCMHEQQAVMTGGIIRRLTPLECERLQGFPDYWTDIGEWTDSRGKKHKPSDSPRYKALGNSIALPFWEWMARRIAAQYERPLTMGSLFDGIGGFPLAFQRAGGKAVWASEIEEFPIAVTKHHFGEE